MELTRELRFINLYCCGCRAKIFIQIGPFIVVRGEEIQKTSYCIGNSLQILKSSPMNSFVHLHVMGNVCMVLIIVIYVKI